jgi:Zn-dependent protease with chaperone function
MHKDITDKILKSWGLHKDLKKEIVNNKVRILLTPENKIGAQTDGRHIYLTYGAVANLSKPQLNAILAHELGHITKKHTRKEKFVALGGLLAGGVSSAVVGAGVLSPAIGVATGELARKIYATYSVEPQADEEAAKYYPKETISILKKVGKKKGLSSLRSTRPSKFHERALNYLLSTLYEHPPVWARIHKIKELEQLRRTAVDRTSKFVPTHT